MNRLQSEVEACLASGKSINNAYFGCYFEQIVHRMLRKGGTFRYRSLEPLEPDKSAQNMTFFRQDTVLKFSRVETIEDSKYYQPDSQTFPSIDSVIAPDNLFQITIATNHPIKMSGLELLYEKLSKGSNIDFFFVVPAKLFDSYQKQEIIDTRKKGRTRRKPDWIRDYLKQHVLEIDLSLSLGSENIDRSRNVDYGSSSIRSKGNDSSSNTGSKEKKGQKRQRNK